MEYYSYHFRAGHLRPWHPVDVASAVTVKGLKDFQKDLRGVDPRLAKTLQVAHKKVSTKATSQVRPAVGGLAAPGSSRTVGGITPRATQTRAKIAFSGAARSRPLVAHILGADWYPVFGRFVRASSMRRRLVQPHLGNSWSWSQLYGAGPALVEVANRFALDEYMDAVMDAMVEAFPERG